MTTTATHTFNGPIVASGTANLPFTFQAITDAEVGVTKDGVELFSGYAVNLNPDGTGHVTPLTSWGTSIIYIFSRPAYTQETSFARMEPFYPDELNHPFDILGRQILALRSLAASKLPLTGGTITGPLYVPDEIYSGLWDGNLSVPTKNALFDKIETMASEWGDITGNIYAQTDLQNQFNTKADLAGGNVFTGDQTVGGHVYVTNLAYGVTWNGSNRVPTMDAIWDKVEGVIASIPPAGVTSFNTRVGAVTLIGNDVTTALGYTPANISHTHPNFTASVAGFAPASGGGAVNYLRADGNWVAPVAVATWGSITGTLSNQTDLQTALNGKANVVHTHVIADTTGLQAALDAKVDDSEMAAMATDAELAAGLATKANTTDLANYIPLTQKGAANGVVPLDGATKISATYLPSYVDDVVEYANLAAFPVTGETGKIYVALDTGKTYRWTGSAYTEISSSTGGVWGTITGTLSNQTDLQTALNAKANLAGGNAFTGDQGITGAITVSGLATFNSSFITSGPSANGVINPTSGNASFHVRATNGASDGVNILASAASGVFWRADKTTYSNRANTVTYGVLDSTGFVMSVPVTVPADPYAVGWNGSLQVPTKDAVYDKIESVVAGIPPAVDITGKVAKAGDTMSGDLNMSAADVIVTDGSVICGVNTLAAFSATFGNSGNPGFLQFTSSVNGGTIQGPTASYVGFKFTAGEYSFQNVGGSVAYATINSNGIDIPTGATYKVNGVPIGGGAVDDTAYGASWDGVTTIAPSKNAVYDKIEALSVGGGGVTTFNTRSGAVTLTSADVTTALTYTPVNKAGDTMTGALTMSYVDAAILINPVTGSSYLSLRGTNGTADGIRMQATGSAGYLDSDTFSIRNRAGSATRAVFSSTGLAVTGTLSATGAISGSNLSGTNTGDQTSIAGITGTKAQFNTALTDDDFAYVNTANTFVGIQTINGAANANGTVNISPSGTAVYSQINMKGNGGTQTNGYSILVGNSTVYYNVDNYVFRSAASVIWATLGSPGFALNVPMTVPADAYAAGWNGSTQVPTKDAVYDQLELLATDIAGKANTSALAGYLPLTGGALSGNLDINKASPQLTLNPSSGASVVELMGAGGTGGFRLHGQTGLGYIRADTVTITDKVGTATYASFASEAITLNGKITNAATQGSVLTGVDQLQLREPGLSAGYTFKMGYLNSVGTHFTGWQGVIDIMQGGVGSVLNLNPSGGIVATGGQLRVPDDAYAVGWNGSLAVPTKNAVYDKIEAVIATIPVGGGVTSFNTRTGAVTLTAADVSAAGANAFTVAGLLTVNDNGTILGKNIAASADNNITIRNTSGISRLQFYSYNTDGTGAQNDGTITGDRSGGVGRIIIGGLGRVTTKIAGADIIDVVAAGVTITGTLAASGAITSGGSTLATVSQLANYLPLTGGTVTGSLTIGGASGGIYFQDRDGSGTPFILYNQSDGFRLYNGGDVVTVDTVGNMSLVGSGGLLWCKGVDAQVTILSKGSVGTFAAANAGAGMEVRSSDATGGTTGAWLAFHRPSATAMHIGLDVDNLFKIGGWSWSYSIPPMTLSSAGVMKLAGTQLHLLGAGQSEIQCGPAGANGIMYMSSTNAGFYRASGSHVYQEMAANGKLVCSGRITAAATHVFRHQSSTYSSSDITYSTSAPSGGADGDMWLQYV